MANKANHPWGFKKNAKKPKPGKGGKGGKCSCGKAGA